MMADADFLGLLAVVALAASRAERAALRDWLATSGARLQAARGVVELQPAIVAREAAFLSRLMGARTVCGRAAATPAQRQRFSGGLPAPDNAAVAAAASHWLSLGDAAWADAVLALVGGAAARAPALAETLASSAAFPMGLTSAAASLGVAAASGFFAATRACSMRRRRRRPLGPARSSCGAARACPRTYACLRIGASSSRSRRCAMCSSRALRGRGAGAPPPPLQ